MASRIFTFPFWVGTINPERLPLWVLVTICFILFATIVFFVAALIIEKKRNK